LKPFWKRWFTFRRIKHPNMNKIYAKILWVACSIALLRQHLDPPYVAVHFAASNLHAVRQQHQKQLEALCGVWVLLWWTQMSGAARLRGAIPHRHRASEREITSTPLSARRTQSPGGRPPARFQPPVRRSNWRDARAAATGERRCWPTGMMILRSRSTHVQPPRANLFCGKCTRFVMYTYAHSQFRGQADLFWPKNQIYIYSYTRKYHNHDAQLIRIMIL